MCVRVGESPTPRVVQGGLRGLAPLSTVALVEGQTLLPGACHDLQVPGRVLGGAQVPDPVHPAAAGVGHVQNLPHRIHRQVVLMGRAGAGYTTGR